MAYFSGSSNWQTAHFILLLFAFLQGTNFQVCGRQHFSWDPIFQPEGFDQTFAELDPAVKSSVFHRGPEEALANATRRGAAEEGRGGEQDSLAPL